MDKVLVVAQGVKKVFQTGDIALEALRGIDLEIGSGEFMAIVGPSGRREDDAAQSNRCARRAYQWAHCAF